MHDRFHFAHNDAEICLHNLASMLKMLCDVFFKCTAATIETEVFDTVPAMTGKSKEAMLEGLAPLHVMVSWTLPLLPLESTTGHRSRHIRQVTCNCLPCMPSVPVLLSSGKTELLYFSPR